MATLAAVQLDQTEIETFRDKKRQELEAVRAFIVEPDSYTGLGLQEAVRPCSSPPPGVCERASGSGHAIALF